MAPLMVLQSCVTHMQDHLTAWSDALVIWIVEEPSEAAQVCDQLFTRLQD